MAPASPPNDSAPKQPYTGESTDYLETQTPKSTLPNQNSHEPKSRFARWWKKIQRLWKRPQPAPTDSTIAPKGIATHIDLAQTQGIPKGNETAVANESQSDTSPTVERQPIDIGTVTFAGQREVEVTNLGNLLGETQSREENTPEPVEEPEFVFKTNPPGLKLERVIGRGGMGVVYEAADTFGRKFAVKVTRPDKMTDRLKERFYSEALEMSKLDSKYLVPIQQYHEHEGLPYFTMQKYESSVSGLIVTNTLTKQSAFRIFCDSIRGLAHLHERGYVHRDFKPGNILVNKEGQGLVSDFGLLKLTVAELTVRSTATDEPILDVPTQTKGVVGTIPYLSPEVLCSESPKPTAKWDLYAAGITLYEMLHGERPPVSSNPYLYVGKSREEAIPPIRKVQPKTPKALEKIIKKCCAVDCPYKDANDLLRDLVRYETRWYRRALVSVCLLFLVTTTTLAMLWPPSQKMAENTIPNPYAELYKELGAGKTVELIPEKGMPRFPVKVILGTETTPNCDNEFGTFGVYTTVGGTTFAQLFPDLPEGEYELRGQLFCSIAAPQAYGGFVVGGQSIEVPRGKVFSGAMLTYGDSTTEPLKVNFSYKSFSIGAFSGHHDKSSDVFPETGKPKWRNFAVRLRTNDIEYEFEKKTAKPLLRTMPDFVQEEFDIVLKPNRPLQNRYTNKGIGLFARGTTTSCRALTITRITPKE